MKRLSLAIQFLAFDLLSRIVRALPLTVVRVAARAIAAACYFVVPVRKDLTLRQIRRAFPDADARRVRRIARGSYRNLVTVILELMWTPRLARVDPSAVVRLDPPDLIPRLRAAGRGVILMSGHFGNWEWLCTCVPRLLDTPCTVIVHPIHHPRVDALVESWRTRFGNRVVPMERAARDVVRTLREGGIVMALADQSAPREALFVPFLGRPAATFSGPAIFSLRTGAPIVIGFAERAADGNYDVHVEEIPSGDLDATAPDAVAELTRRHVAALEAAILRRPDLWLWQHRRWKHEAGPESVVVAAPV